MEIIVGLGVGAIVLYLWGWQRFKYVRWHLQRHKRAEAFERSLRDAREAIGGACPYRKPSASDSELLSLLPDDRELVACGFKPVGELVLQHAGKPPRLALRCYLDAAGTTYAMRASQGILRFASYASERVFATGQRPHVVLAEPPFVARQMLDAKLSVAEVVAAHRKLVGDQALLRIENLDDLLAQLSANHEKVVAWRASVPPDELLDLDLKCVLGDAYPRAGKIWARKLRDKLPEARVLRDGT